MAFLIELDGSVGEGGGQILRTALTLSLLTQRPFHIKNIRANRPNPGLATQHVMAIKAALAISESTARRAEIQSQDVYFDPGKVKAGSYVFSVSTAGAMPLVLQTLALPLCLQPEPSFLEFTGGTHVPWAPSTEYLREVWIPIMQKLGIEISLEMKKAGYYPKGGGSFTVRIAGGAHIKPLNFLERGTLKNLEAIVILSDLTKSIADREWKELSSSLANLSLGVKIKQTLRTYPSLGPGNMLLLIAKFENSIAGFDSLGEKGKPSEAVAKDVAAQFCQFMETSSAIDMHLADQILLPLCINPEPCRYSVSQIDEHLPTNATIIREFLPVNIQIQGKTGYFGTVEISKPTESPT